MKCTGRCVGVSKDLISGKYQIVLSVNEESAIMSQYDQIKDVDVDIEVKKHRKKRSLDANAYSWVLLDKMAKVLRTTSEELYEQMLRQYGYPLYDEEEKPVMISLLSTIDVSLLDMHLKLVGKGHVGDKLFHHYKVIRGQSDYDTKEMSTYIDGLVDEAKALGIETLTPDELERMKATWKA